MLAAALAVVAAFDWEVAVTVTVLPEGNVAGAVKLPCASIVPTAALPPWVPFTLQLTAGGVADGEAMAAITVNCMVPPTGAVAGLGETVKADCGAGVGVGVAAEAALDPPPHPVQAINRAQPNRA